MYLVVLHIYYKMIQYQDKLCVFGCEVEGEFLKILDLCPEVGGSSAL